MNTASRALVGSAVVAPALLVLPLPGPVAVIVAVALLGVLPGAALARALGSGDPVLSVLLTVAGSVAVTIAVSTVLLYLRVWSGPAAGAGVGLVTVIFVLVAERGRLRDLA